VIINTRTPPELMVLTDVALMLFQRQVVNAHNWPVLRGYYKQEQTHRLSSPPFIEGGNQRGL
jgi:hypothetical protein